MSIKVSNELKVYEINGVKMIAIPQPTITIRSYWNGDDRVVLEIDGKSYTLIARELEVAIRNATNKGES